MTHTYPLRSLTPRRLGALYGLSRYRARLFRRELERTHQARPLVGEAELDRLEREFEDRGGIYGEVDGP